MPSDIELYCYCCEEPKVGDEHVPPQSFFAKGNRAGLIKVPSCKLHNQDKSADDEYIRSVLLSSIELDGNEAIASNFEVHSRALKRSGERLKSKLLNDADIEIFLKLQEEFKDDPCAGVKIFSELEKSGICTGLLGLLSNDYRDEVVVASDGVEHKTISYSFDKLRFLAYFKLMAKALFYHETKWPWLGEVVLIPHNFVSRDATENEIALHRNHLNLIDRESSQGAHKEVFYYGMFTHLKNERTIDYYSVNFCLYDHFKFTAIMTSENFISHKERI
ncbi:MULTISPECIES: hypothetical protein [Pseudomonadaceae]|uniref:hypothetical protein n=1 Tax=Pseudomonadaceae TaxID=135621 RepID=UPI00190AC941|nr:MULTISPECIES: hypothetical protein [Pseudomonadaceae]MBK3447558.1 hypothetical protein [Pseudomonas haemolytica]MCQ4320712.1 hypothetical protein [Stutzerimonas stutzeri]